jgi:P4 family phage/plasmid primase-like protien
VKPLDDNDVVRERGHAAFDPMANLVPFVLPGDGERAQSGTDSSAATRELRLGSDVEVGQRTLDLLRQDDVPIVFDRGEFYRYAAAMGIWQPLPRAEIERTVHRFDGASCTDGDGKLYKANQPRVVGAVARAAAIAEKTGFFAAAPPGLAFMNGFLNVSADGARLMPHSPDHRVTVGLSMSYDPAARPHRHERYLSEVFAPDDPADADAKKQLIQQFVGATLVGIATRFQAALVLTGAGSNGKSVLIDVVKALFPPASVIAIAPQELGQEYRRAMLASARLNAVSEMPEREVIDSEAFKAIISGDTITGRRIREAPFSFRPAAGHLLSANRLPGTTDQSHGFWRRMLPIEFRRQFSAADKDTELASKIIAAEMPGVAAWAIEGAVSVMRAGRYTIPPCVLAAREEWQRNSDQVRLFAEEKLRASPETETTGSVIYGHYSDWAKQNGHRALASNNFFPRLTALEMGIERRRTSASNVYTCEIRRASDLL